MKLVVQLELKLDTKIALEHHPFHPSHSTHHHRLFNQFQADENIETRYTALDNTVKELFEEEKP